MSCPRILVQSASISGLLEKNRWGPTSNRQPMNSRVRAIPPTWLSCSITVTGLRCRLNSWAADMPAGPAPITTTCSLDPGEFESVMTHKSNLRPASQLAPELADYLTIAPHGRIQRGPQGSEPPVPGTAPARTAPRRRRYGNPAPCPGGRLRALL